MHIGMSTRLWDKKIFMRADGKLDWDETICLHDDEEGFEDLCHLWVKRACRHAEWEGELI
jgi:hypothetical protein